MFVRTPFVIIIEKKLGKTLSKAVSKRALVIRDITVSNAKLISWKQSAPHYIENNFTKMK